MDSVFTLYVQYVLLKLYNQKLLSANYTTKIVAIDVLIFNDNQWLIDKLLSVR
jgi:uncharacterized membrane protein (DUF485 family)